MDSSIGDREQTGYIEEGELAIEFGFSGAVLTRSVAHRKSQATGPHDSQLALVFIYLFVGEPVVGLQSLSEVTDNVSLA
jgi:hypothetical protein